jgi:hypothetical protein
MTKLRVYDNASYCSLFSTDATVWSRLTDVEVGLYGWMEDRRDRDFTGLTPYRINQGHHHREDEEDFDDKSFGECRRDHMVLGNDVIQGACATFEELLQSLYMIFDKYPQITMKPIRNLRDITLHPFHLVNIMHQRRSIFGRQPHTPQPQQNPVSTEVAQKSMRWLAQKCDWKPILSWDSMMCDVFPANLG